MSDQPTHRATRRNLSTQPVPRGVMGPPVKGPRLRHSHISPDELAYIIDRAREQRTEEDITAYRRSKR